MAARLCYGALGSDTGGSIRQPSAYCGIVGLKPTYGLVSTTGVIPLSWSLDHVGPMCRNVADTGVLLQAIAGYDPRDTNSVDAAAPDYVKALEQKVSAFRIGIPRAVFYEGLDAEIEHAVNDALQVLRGLTASTRDVVLPPYRTLPVVGAEAYAFPRRTSRRRRSHISPRRVSASKAARAFPRPRTSKGNGSWIGSGGWWRTCLRTSTCS